MEQQEKLKLLRGLFFLSQDEMARLAECQRSFYAAAESKNKMPLSEKQAMNIQRHLGFDSVWFAESSDKQPLISNRLLVINMDWKARLLGVTANVRSSRINIAESAVAQYLPKLLEDAGAVACYQAQAPGGGLLVLFQLNSDEPQGLILCVTAGQKISVTVEAIAEKHVKNAPTINLTDKEYAEASVFSKVALGKFIKRCTIAGEAAALFENALEANEQQYFEYDKLFGNAARESTLLRILQDMRYHGITPDEVIKAYGNDSASLENKKTASGNELGAVTFKIETKLTPSGLLKNGSMYDDIITEGFKRDNITANAVLDSKKTAPDNKPSAAMLVIEPKLASERLQKEYSTPKQPMPAEPDKV